MLPGEGHEWQDNDLEALSTEASKKKRKAIYGRLELKPPDFEVSEFGAGSHRKIYLGLEVKLNATEYAQTVVEGGKGAGGTDSCWLGLHHQGAGNFRQGKAGIVDGEPVYLRSGGIVHQATAVSGAKGKREATEKVSVSAGRVPFNVEVEHQVVAWINDLRSDQASARVTTCTWYGQAQGH